ncbi:MFS transporter [Clostridium niameyense]|uniref:MFS transporter n=1 Tax=Clostridium niameyense TaxID=1622073 RepID=A0A6M0R8Z5_9CLOT|nr:MFS transporter [Clostridium niameyense]NEZ46247.1 MFS transporter [Clostridium niameyense]
MEKLNKKNSSKGMLMLVVLWFAYVAFAINWVTGSTLGGEVVKTFFNGPVPPVILQVINYTITAARVFANFIAALILMKTGPKRAIRIALGLLMLSVVAVWMPNYWVYTVARMIMALGGSMIVVYMNPVVANYVSSEKKMIANALNTVSYNFGAFLTAILFLSMNKVMRADWRITMTAVSIITVVLFIIWIAGSEDFDTKTNVTGNSIVEYTYLDGLKDPFVWKYSLGFAGFVFLYILSITSFPAAFPQYAPKINGSMINLLVTGFAILGTVLGTKLGLTDISRKKTMFISGIIMIVSFAIVLYFSNISASIAYVFAAISGFFMFIQYPIYMNLAHEMKDMSPQKLTIIFGLLWAIAYSFYTVLTVIWSLILGKYGWNAASVFYIVSSCLYLVMVLTLPETSKKYNK